MGKRKSTIALEELHSTTRDTSPPRTRLSTRAQSQLNAMVKHLFVPAAPTTSTEVPMEMDKDDDEMDAYDDSDLKILFSSTTKESLKMEMGEENDECNFEPSQVSKYPSFQASSQFDETRRYDYDEEGDNKELARLRRPTWRKILNYEKRIGTNFHRFTNAENANLWRRNLYEDKRKKTSKVQFVDYDSPLNKMRLFVRPNEQFFNADDGPMTDRIDFSLSDGFNVLATRKIMSPLVCGSNYDCEFMARTREGPQYLVRKTQSWMHSYCGNILGRFWYLRDRHADKYPGVKDSNYDQKRRQNFGLLRYYTLEELIEVFGLLLPDVQIAMRRGVRRENMPVSTVVKLKEKDREAVESPVQGVLLLTDWRLVHLFDNTAIVNAIIHYFPTNLGGVFFEAMTEYLTELLLDNTIEFHTIIFAFGGTPTFKKQDFLAFWKKLIVRTTQSIDVFWMAQDWCDGLNSTQEEIDQLNEFNHYVEQMFTMMRKNGNINYNYCDIRKQYNIPSLDPSFNRPNDFLLLEPIYRAYINHFVDECNCYLKGPFVKCQPRVHNGYAQRNGTKLEFSK
ncbi:SWIM-type domain-containing protein [Caenorhabditis elegans]|uniref:SWIM-type domain-containing protein n=1 Tax=Caenorhabditis elegans TaxID=6239 RepID=A0A2K5ATT7_CAEEL|nr:SWIM-type domain-containing protein [Caenorhabditis elegans]SPC47533.1 SWIM-type domain-containing protein [Caenorhabditis elegans]|eukprot:NP_001348738.1 Uncharacterized protein CELE_C14B1.6 [Caenorhabditis elegans]